MKQAFWADRRIRPLYEKLRASEQARLYAIAAIGLLALHLTAFAGIWYLNAHSTDDWNYMGTAQRANERGEWFHVAKNREFWLQGMMLSQAIMPGRFQGMHYVHLAALYVISLCLFHLFLRIKPDQVWFAYLFAAVYLVYIPFNNAYVTSWLSNYSWALMLGSLAVVLLLEHTYQTGYRRWLMLAVGALFSYMALRAIEALMPVLPFAAILLLYLNRRLTRPLIFAVGVWWVANAVAILRFAVPYVQGDTTASYQESYRAADEKLDLAVMLKDMGVFYRSAFPVDTIIKMPVNYIAPPLIMALVFGVITLLLWRRSPTTCTLPSPKQLALMLIIGVTLVGLGGIAFVYAGVADVSRSQFFAAPGQALIIASLLGALAVAGERLLNLKAMVFAVSVGMIFFFVAGQWFYQAQVHWNTSISFHEKTIFLRYLVANLPNLEDDTLVLFQHCKDSEGNWYPPAIAGAYEPNTVRYLYGHVHRSGVQAGYFTDQPFDTTGVLFPPFFSFDPVPAQHYRYDQLVIVACEDRRVRVVEHFPPGYAPFGAPIETYNPYARIKGGFIPSDRSLILGK